MSTNYFEAREARIAALPPMNKITGRTHTVMNSGPAQSIQKAMELMSEMGVSIINIAVSKKD